MKILLSVVITLVVLFGLLMIYMYSGWHDVSAMHEDHGMMKWIMRTTKNNSIESRIKEISVPNLENPEMIKEGFEHYNAMCAGCHGAPGMDETELSKGLNPHAPYLPRVAAFIEPAEIFWATKNGINMTGMPAWGKTHSDEKIWAIVAFTKKLPDMSADDYKKMANETEENENHHNGEEHNNHSHN